MFKSQKHVFWQALVLALVVFNIGIFLGYSLEASRASKINKLYVESELELLDVKIQSEAFSVAPIDCGKSIEENIKFADKIYENALLSNVDPNIIDCILPQSTFIEFFETGDLLTYNNIYQKFKSGKVNS